jgi:hypothetical protein
MAHDDDFFAPVNDPTREQGLGRRIDPELARHVNERVNELSLVFVEVVGEERPAVFLCECGCGEFVEMLATDYDAGGCAVLPEHVG